MRIPEFYAGILHFFAARNKFPLPTFLFPSPSQSPTVKCYQRCRKRPSFHLLALLFPPLVAGRSATTSLQKFIGILARFRPSPLYLSLLAWKETSQLESSTKCAPSLWKHARGSSMRAMPVVRLLVRDHCPSSLHPAAPPSVPYFIFARRGEREAISL